MANFVELIEALADKARSKFSKAAKVIRLTNDIGAECGKEIFALAGALADLSVKKFPEDQKEQMKQLMEVQFTEDIVLTMALAQKKK